MRTTNYDPRVLHSYVSESRVTMTRSCIIRQHFEMAASIDGRSIFESASALGGCKYVRQRGKREAKTTNEVVVIAKVWARYAWRRRANGTCILLCYSKHVQGQYSETRICARGGAILHQESSFSAWPRWTVNLRRWEQVDVPGYEDAETMFHLATK